MMDPKGGSEGTEWKKVAIKKRRNRNGRSLVVSLSGAPGSRVPDYEGVQKFNGR